MHRLLLLIINKTCCMWKELFIKTHTELLQTATEKVMLALKSPDIFRLQNLQTIEISTICQVNGIF